ncbi:MAG: flippase-like domain-containing protein [Verrucomicrobia bacterium]|nr:flippase-like domain-containing protein [Verrucomicrobiota bacterium]MCG2681650.1 flippase-like domain-containing protein [Kiritimatiellia bacterium]MBU4248102.1 flippase-like domain-containing protein [Verrucomicrobiota bacterium]MBU4290778.1 flippase-like domain-containing protein [Verrucomicrobiota bacterium]MBU4429747.1 flippase-like domain-containing protein [Verrucomicrobiota bacterium]
MGLSFSHIKPVIKIVISLLLLGYTMYLVDWRSGLDLVPRANIGLMLLAVFLLTLERVVSVFKWLLLLRAKGSDVSFWRLFIINYVGGFWGLILPSSVSADIVRGYYLAKTTAGLALTVTSMLVDRVIAGLALVTLAAVSVWLAGDRFGFVHHRAVVVLGVAACVLAVFLLFRPSSLRWINQQIVQRITHWIAMRYEWNLNRHIHAWVQSCLEYRRYPGLLVLSFLSSILVQIIRVLIFYTVALGFNVHAPLLYYLMFIPLIMVLIMLPVSFNGIGIREGSFVAFFAMVGVSSADAFVVSFTVSLLTTLTTAVGGLIYLFDKGSSRRAQKKEVLSSP